MCLGLYIAVTWEIAHLGILGAPPVAQWYKKKKKKERTHLQCRRLAGDLVLIPDQEDPLEKEMATHFIILALKNPMDRANRLATVHGVIKSQT